MPFHARPAQDNPGLLSHMSSLQPTSQSRWISTVQAVTDERGRGSDARSAGEDLCRRAVVDQRSGGAAALWWRRPEGCHRRVVVDKKRGGAPSPPRRWRGDGEAGSWERMRPHRPALWGRAGHRTTIRRGPLPSWHCATTTDDRRCGGRGPPVSCAAALVRGKGATVV
jgi:hypothetical protein